MSVTDSQTEHVSEVEAALLGLDQVLILDAVGSSGVRQERMEL